MSGTELKDLAGAGSLDLGDLFDELKPKTEVAKAKPASWGKVRNLYVDIETIPDDSRVDQFGLDPLPQPPTRLAMKDCGPVADVADHDIPGIKSWLSHNNPCDEFLDALAALEREAKKPRKGVLDAIADYVASLEKIGQAAAERRKKLSLTPEYCRICALCIAGDGADVVESYVVGLDGQTEASILARFWQVAEAAQAIIGFNVIGFDLPVIITRSALLGVVPSRFIDLSPYKSDVLDLMAKRWPRGGQMGLKAWGKSLGFPADAGDVDGSQVAELFATDPEKLRAYNKSDVMLTRMLHRQFAGLFWQR